MNINKNELAEWLTDLCGGDKECEQNIRWFIRQDKSVINQINVEFKKGNTKIVRRIITNYLSENNRIIRSCNVCNKKHFISTDKLIGMKCKKCNELLPLLKKEIYESNSSKIEENLRKCIYCNKPVSPLEKAMTCFEHRSGYVGFSQRV